jgi:ferredoxin
VSVAVSVDPQQCALQGYCERIAPDVFELRDGETTVHVLRESVDGAELEELLEEAEASCPTRAIRLAKA